MNHINLQSESQTSIEQISNNLQDTDLDDATHCLPESEFCIHKIANFVIGISKPGQMRIGLKTIQKNKITIKGIIGIDGKS